MHKLQKNNGLKRMFTEARAGSQSRPYFIDLAKLVGQDILDQAHKFTQIVSDADLFVDDFITSGYSVLELGMRFLNTEDFGGSLGAQMCPIYQVILELCLRRIYVHPDFWAYVDYPECHPKFFIREVPDWLVKDGGLCENWPLMCVQRVWGDTISVPIPTCMTDFLSLKLALPVGQCPLTR